MNTLDGYEVLATLVETETKVLLRARTGDGRPVIVKLLNPNAWPAAST